MASTYEDRIQGTATSVAIKAPVIAATVTNITLSGLQTIDGVVLVAGDRVLVKDQTSAVMNGIWVAQVGAWYRAKDFNGSRDIVFGTQVFVASGSSNGSLAFFVTTRSPVIGTTSIEFDGAFDATTRDEVIIPADGRSGTYPLAFVPPDQKLIDVLLDGWDLTRDVHYDIVPDVLAASGLGLQIILNASYPYSSYPNAPSSFKVRHRRSLGNEVFVPIDDFATRAALVSFIGAGGVIPNGRTVTAAGLRYMGASGATSLSGLPGLVAVDPEWGHYADTFTEGINLGTTALSTAGGGTLHVRAGEYTQTASIVWKSNVTVLCDPGVKIDANGFSDDVFTVAGTVSAEYPLTAAATRDDTQIECAQVFAVGNFLHLVSVRNALSRTDTGDWWCGDGTGSSQYAYFAEWLEVAEVVSAGVYRISKPLIFPNYLVTDAGETETERTTSTVKLVTPLVNAHWIGGAITRTTAGSDCLDSAWADGCTIRDTVFNRGTRAGGSVRWGASRNCQAINVTTINDPTLLWDYGTHHGTMNRYKVAGAQDCGFIACKDSYGAQSVDFTYGNVSGAVANYVNVRPFCRDGEFTACFEGLTSHPGCYQEQWAGNRILGCQSDGIVIRGLEPEVRGNLITGAYTPGNDDPDFSRVGVMFQYGGTRRLIASDNTVRGFHAAFGLLDSATLEWQFRNIDGTISDNEVSGCYTGLYTDLDAWAGLRNLVYAGNDHAGMGRYIALLGTYSAGMAILNNTLLSDFVYSGSGVFVGLVRAEANNPALRIEGNRWLRNKSGNAGKTKYITNISGVTDTTTYPSADYAGKTVIENNDANYPTELTADAVSLTGYSQRQWGIASQTGANIASGVATYVPHKNGRGVVQVDTESAAASDDLDTLVPATGAAPVVGDIIILRTTVSARDVVIRDVTTSAASAYGFQLPGDTSITLSDSSDTAMFMFGGTHWLWIAGGDN